MAGNYEEGIMKSMLEFLFSSEITFPGSWAAENRFGDELDEVTKLGGADQGPAWGGAGGALEGVPGEGPAAGKPAVPH